MADNLTTGSTYAWTPNAAGLTLDGTTWDLTGATVTLYLTDPNGNETPYDVPVTNAAAGIAQRRGLATDLPIPGQWQRCYRVQQGSIDLTSLPVGFRVVQAR